MTWFSAFARAKTEKASENSPNAVWEKIWNVVIGGKKTWVSIPDPEDESISIRLNIVGNYGYVLADNLAESLDGWLRKIINQCSKLSLTMQEWKLVLTVK